MGDLPGNCARIRAAAEAARYGRADVVVFPELVVPGYPPRDLLLDPSFVEATILATEALAHELKGGPPVVVGTIARAPSATPQHPGLYNVAAVLSDGRVSDVRAKQLLPIYDVFHEPRWFIPGPTTTPVELAGKRVGLIVCEDLWEHGYPVHPASHLVAEGAELLVNISASPFRSGVLAGRHDLAGRHGVPLVFVNAVGANDELIFDGGGFIADERGRLLWQLPRFDEAVTIFDFDDAGPVEVALPDPNEELYEALVLGVRDFARKNGLRTAFLGLSGGVDSAVVACIARDALGPEVVTAIAMPSRYNDPRSTETARELAKGLGIACEVVSIESLHASADETLAHLVDGDAGVGVDENIQSRLRAIILMAHVNRRGGVLLNTSNKTELTLGYGTLYGDMAGTLGVIADLTKPQIYALARWYNERHRVIPEFILTRPPSAELKLDQVDPFDYDREAPIAEALVQGTATPEGADEDTIARFRTMLWRSEHKRWQAGIVLKVSEKSFGTGRMLPVTRANVR